MIETMIETVVYMLLVMIYLYFLIIGLIKFYIIYNSLNSDILDY